MSLGHGQKRLWVQGQRLRWTQSLSHGKVIGSWAKSVGPGSKFQMDTVSKSWKNSLGHGQTQWVQGKVCHGQSVSYGKVTGSWAKSVGPGLTSLMDTVSKSWKSH